MRTICLHYEQVCNYIDNDPFCEEWYSYCKKYHCEICKENSLDCSSCKGYEVGMHIASACIYYDNCLYKDKCTDAVDRNCVGYREE